MPRHELATGGWDEKVDTGCHLIGIVMRFTAARVIGLHRDCTVTARGSYELNDRRIGFRFLSQHRLFSCPKLAAERLRLTNLVSEITRP